MNETVQKFRNRFVEFWSSKSKTQKIGMVGGLVGLPLILIVSTLLFTSSNMVPLYSNLSHQEAGQLTSELDSRGVKYELTDGGTTILVPDAQSDRLLVDFAAQGIPNSGNIDYSFFSENVSWGMTDEERQIIELDALQTELASLISNIQGIESAKVLINQPKESIFVGDQQESSSASIVLNTEYGYEFSQSKIRSLYHLVSKAVPNLPTENIVIMNQNFEYFDLNTNTTGNGNTYVEHQQIKEDIERDLQRRVQRVLGTMIGQDKVVVSVTTDIDFTRENRVEELVEPVDLENMEGLPVSVDRVTETYAGIDGGQIPSDVTDIPEYLGQGDTDDLSEYEMVRETINNEFNRIRRDIVESPYEVRDIGIQVAVDNSVEENGEQVTLSAAEQQSVEEDVQSILSSMIETSISADVINNTETFNPADKVSIVFQPFSEGTNISQPVPTIPTWVYVVGGGLLLLVILLIFLVLRRRNEDDELVETEESYSSKVEELPLEEDLSDSGMRRKQLENLAKDKPEEFAKLLRTWISED
ncbi:flagellar basal body M-ring protein FliF [Filobacillus milosensis]|uniref:Flagellar M-ring protein n=1 Tax=Filobacillus milosensis TaxID=94137 RepID=A0A4Y8IVF2_9BACI|nr:flagellar basal-body MS-ring/collar protein FliF [Filobacillus milosensis]TFB23216.1 flagellar basal body M-ring protein FliF [Filobacillus milosensis]